MCPDHSTWFGDRKGLPATLRFVIIIKL